MTKKIQVTFDDHAVEILETLKKASGAASNAQVLREAIGFYDWAREEIVEKGRKVGAMKKGDVVSEVHLKFHKKRR